MILIITGGMKVLLRRMENEKKHVDDECVIGDSEGEEGEKHRTEGKQTEKE